jgi:hypothetical protein
VETASQTGTENYVTALTANWHMSTKMSLELALNQDFQFVNPGASTNQFTDSRLWSTMDWLNYQFWPKFGAAIGIGAGYDQLSVGSDMTFVQLQGRINWTVADKLIVLISGGVEDRQFLESSAPDLINPIFNANIRYQLFEQTALTLTASRTVNSSIYQNQITESAVVSAGVSQRFFRKLYFDLSGGYQSSSYKATTLTTTGIANLNRQDNYAFAGVRLTTHLLRRATAAVYYQYSRNLSNASGFGYASSQGGLELGYRF